MELDYVKLKPIKPAVSGYIMEAMSLLKESLVPGDKAVHDIRVLMKKSRALLKLAAPQLDSQYSARDLADLKEVGKIMCSWRETSVHRKTVKELRKEFPDIFSRLNDHPVLNQLLSKQVFASVPDDIQLSSVEKIGNLLNKTSYRIRFQSMNVLDPRIMIKQLETAYIMITDIYLDCRNNPKSSKLHQLRMKTKDFLYQLYVFRPLNPSLIKTLEKRLDSMTQNLGKFNDLSQILITLDYQYRKGINPEPLDELVVKIREKQDRCLNKVWPVAYQYFCPGQKLVNILGFKLLMI
jgi:CHAD domain-containing protein